MKSDPLCKLFGSTARVKLLRLFLFNPRLSYTVPDAAQRSRVPERTARREINLFTKAGLIKRARLRSAGARYALNPDFQYLLALQSLLLNAPARGADIADSLRSSGALKLVVLSGIFLGEWDGRLDLLVVGDRMKEKKLRAAVRRLEAELGKEVRYSLLNAEQFLYRLGINDHLVRDVLDYPHKIVLDKLQIGLK
jgi:hypothetical protein